jgi:hypothetical protein
MLFGIWLGSVGYAIFYWGIHHFPGVDCKSDSGCRISLIDALGIPAKWNIPKGRPVQLGVPTGAITATQQQNPNNNNSNPMTGGGSGDWASKLASGIAAPQSAIAKFQAWNACEGNLQGHSGLGINNPLNITADSYQPATHGDGGAVNSAGVQSFSTITLGIQGTLAKLSEPFASGIVANLRNDGTWPAFANAVGSSGWGTSGSCIASKATA